MRTATVTPDGLQMSPFNEHESFVIAEFCSIKAWQSNKAMWPSPRKLAVPAEIAHWLFMSPVAFTTAAGKSLRLKDVPALLEPRGLTIAAIVDTKVESMCKEEQKEEEIGEEEKREEEKCEEEKEDEDVISSAESELSDTDSDESDNTIA
jgi:hypothetical protein